MSDNEAPRDPTKAIAGRHGRRNSGPLPLTYDVVRLIRVQRSPVGHIRPCGEERADVPHCHLR